MDSFQKRERERRKLQNRRDKDARQKERSAIKTQLREPEPGSAPTLPTDAAIHADDVSLSGPGPREPLP